MLLKQQVTSPVLGAVVWSVSCLPLIFLSSSPQRKLQLKESWIISFFSLFISHVPTQWIFFFWTNESKLLLLHLEVKDPLIQYPPHLSHQKKSTQTCIKLAAKDLSSRLFLVDLQKNSVVRMVLIWLQTLLKVWVFFHLAWCQPKIQKITSGI